MAAGLRAAPQRPPVMVDKLFSAPRDSLRDTIGTLDGPMMERVGEALRLWLQL